MLLQEKIREDMTQAMKAKEEVRLRVLRSLVTLFTNELTATKRTPRDILTDEEVLALIKRSIKQRREAAIQFRAGKREELALNEDIEAKVLEAYMPPQASKEDIEKVVKEKMRVLNIENKNDMGKLMGAVMLELKGIADGTDVKEVIEKLLT
jgi:uncharacterized protein YqeY